MLFLAVWACLFFGIPALMVGVLVKRSRMRALRERVAPQYRTTLPPHVPPHLWGPPDTQRPAFDAPGGLPNEPSVIRVLLRGPYRYESLYGAGSTLVDSTLVTTFYYAGQYHTVDGGLGDSWCDACAHFPLPVRAPFTYVLAKSAAEQTWPSGVERVSFESDDFNRAFIVATTDRAFATTFVTERVIAVMLSEPRLEYVVAAGADVVLGLDSTTPGSAVTDPEVTLAFVTGFLECLPQSLRMPSRAAPTAAS